MSIFKLFTDIGVCEMRTCEKIRRLYTVTRRGVQLHMCGNCIFLTDPHRLQSSKQRRVRVKSSKFVKSGKLRAK